MKHHPKYANGKAKELNLNSEAAISTKLIDGWVHDISLLYDQNNVPELHGRLFILGLSLLDKELEKQLSAKIFQLTVSLPRMSNEAQQRYWEDLLKTIPYHTHSGKPKEFEEGQEKLKSARNEEEIKVVKKGTGNPFYDERLRGAAALTFASPDVENHTQHMLKPFAMLLDPNPRTMKRLVNAYGIARAMDLLSGGYIERKEF